MARALRISYPNAFYHVSCRGKLSEFMRRFKVLRKALLEIEDHFAPWINDLILISAMIY